MPINTIIACAGGSGLKVLQILEDKESRGGDGLKLIGFIDDNSDLWGTEFYGYPIFGGTESVPGLIEKYGELGAVCPIGNTVNRRKMIERLKPLGVSFPSAIHPSAQLSKRAEIGKGNVFSQNTVVQAGAEIGDFNTFNIGSVVGPLGRVGNFCTINAHVMVASLAFTGDFTYIGMGAHIREKIIMGDGTTVGANAFVNEPTEPWSVVVGLPAKKIKQKENPFTGSEK